mgnify:CR=1 FL=1
MSINLQNAEFILSATTPGAFIRDDLPQLAEGQELTYKMLMTDMGRYTLDYFLAASKSRHNQGIAMDLTIVDLWSGEELEMQTSMHDLSWYSELRRNNANANTLARIMEEVGFAGIVSEWWHFQDDVARDNFNMVTFRLENGCAGYYEVAWGQSIRTNNLKEFIGTKGRITLDMVISRSEDGEEGDRITVYHSDTGVYETVNVQTKYKDMYGQVCTLIDMIENDTEGNPTIDSVFSAFKIAAIGPPIFF